jgi:hypothetical protein
MPLRYLAFMTIEEATIIVKARMMKQELVESEEARNMFIAKQLVDSANVLNDDDEHHQSIVLIDPPISSITYTDASSIVGYFTDTVTGMIDRGVAGVRSTVNTQFERVDRFVETTHKGIGVATDRIQAGALGCLELAQNGIKSSIDVATSFVLSSVDRASIASGVVHSSVERGIAGMQSGVDIASTAVGVVEDVVSTRMSTRRRILETSVECATGSLDMALEVALAGVDMLHAGVKTGRGILDSSCGLAQDVVDGSKHAAVVIGSGCAVSAIVVAGVVSLSFWLSVLFVLTVTDCMPDEDSFE